jgi:hypothetical protein
MSRCGANKNVMATTVRELNVNRANGIYYHHNISSMLTNLPCSAIRKLYALPMECYKRGDFEVQLQIDGIGGVKELALAAAISDVASASQYVVFFKTEDCDPDNVIDNAWLDSGCSSRLPNVPTDYKSWSVWDMCITEPGCTLE